MVPYGRAQSAVMLRTWNNGHCVPDNERLECIPDKTRKLNRHGHVRYIAQKSQMPSHVDACTANAFSYAHFPGFQDSGVNVLALCKHTTAREHIQCDIAYSDSTSKQQDDSFLKDVVVPKPLQAFSPCFCRQLLEALAVHATVVTIPPACQHVEPTGMAHDRAT